jgi:hypothetical protein
MNVDHLPGDLTVPSFGSRMVYAPGVGHLAGAEVSREVLGLILGLAL